MLRGVRILGSSVNLLRYGGVASDAHDEGACWGRRAGQQYPSMFHRCFPSQAQGSPANHLVARAASRLVSILETHCMRGGGWFPFVWTLFMNSLPCTWLCAQFLNSYELIVFGRVLSAPPDSDVMLDHSCFLTLVSDCVGVLCMMCLLWCRVSVLFFLSVLFPLFFDSLFSPLAS